MTSTLGVVLGLLTAGAHAAPEPRALPFGLDLLPYLGVSAAGHDTPRVVSLNVVGGLSGGTQALEISPGFAIDDGELQGAQLAGGFNVVTGRVTGVQLAGGFNVAAEMRGAQLAGGINIANGARGAQLAAFNLDASRTRGAQLGVLNIAHGSDGAQIGVLNIASDDVRGLQLGVLNVAPRASAGVGLLNVYWKGFLQVEALASEDGVSLAGVRHGSGALYNVYYVGVRPFGDQAELAYGVGIGGRGDVSDRVELATDVVGIQVLRDFGRTPDMMTKLRGLAGVQLTEDVGLFGGPTLSMRFTTEDVGERLAPYRVWTLSEGSVGVTAWPGLTAGLRFL